MQIAYIHSAVNIVYYMKQLSRKCINYYKKRTWIKIVKSIS